MKTNPLIHHLLLAVVTTGLSLAQAPSGPPAQGQPRVGQPPQHRAMRPRPSHRPMAPNPGPARPSDPLPGLTADLLTAFSDGLEEFTNVEDAEGGLGPIFNQSSCVACHLQGGTGGASTITVTRFGRVNQGVFDPLESLGGSLLQALSIDPAAREFVPREANIVSRRQTTPLFGLGLVEAIPESTILAGVRSGKPDGVRGKVHRVTDVVSGQTKVGRFGWKAQQATLLAFSADAYVNEMGVTSRFFPTENAPNGKADVLAAFDDVADPEDTIDPETGKADIDHSADFMRFLAPLRPLPLTASAMAGRTVFQSTGCAVCHTPRMFTGTHEIAALSQKAVDLYSDLLLHDMGILGDGIVQGDAGPREFKTPPLWGARVSVPYLHDGRAPTLDAAIRAHDGEAAPSKIRYTKLSLFQRQQLLDFIGTL
jgi:CxxC motif-containing protein (DUF1111 family)